jgi:hypothetical protein
MDEKLYNQDALQQEGGSMRKADTSIYLVDNKQGGIDFAGLMYTVPN